MKQTKSLLALLLVVLMVVSAVGCAKKIDVTEYTAPTEAPAETKPAETQAEAQPAETQTEAQPAEVAATYADGTTLRIAAGYNSRANALTFEADKAGEGVTLADGKTYHTGDLKPTWVEVENLLKIKIEDKFTGAGSATKEFDYWKERLDEVDLVVGGASQLSEYGEEGAIVNLADHLDEMPNFKAYLDANPIVRLSITGNTSTGAIYFAPYFDGVNDIERMPLMRTDWVEKLLNGEGEFSAEASKDIAAPVYQPYMPTSGKVEVEVVNLDGKTVDKIAKDYDAAGNIVASMNEKGVMTGVEAVNKLREYIDKAYNGYYGTDRANLFIGQNAAWDADELVALLRCVVANPQTLNGTDTVQGLFSREDNNNQRRVDMFRFAGHLFGVRGMESRQDYLYIGSDGQLHDARQETAAYDALARMNDMVKEGIISEAFVKSEEVKTENYLEQDLGFMHYDYNQTQTLYNATKLDNAAGEKYMAVMVPVARWFDGTNEDGVFMRFTESWRSVKTDAWGISIKGVADDENKLNAAIQLLDFAYSERGQILMSYGPDAFIKTNADGSYETFNFNGKEMPVIADATYAELWEKAGGNYTNYARNYLGSTLSFVKSQAFEYQCTHEVGREGAGHISVAIGLGTIKHPELAITENPWYTSVPTVLPNTKVENDQIKAYSDLSTKFASNKGGENLFVDQIVNGYAAEGMGDAESSAKFVSESMGGAQYLLLKQDAWNRLQKYYETLSK